MRRNENRSTLMTRNWPLEERGKLGAALVHRDPPGVVLRLRKIQCISQKTWNYLRCWLRGGPGPLAAQGGRAAKGPGRGKKSKIN